MNYKIAKVIYGDQFSHIAKLRMLVVGVGGIGCQILKCLCKMPLQQLDILDLDTIETSNLNRQFLFKQTHRGSSKALTAKQTISRLNPNILINAHHANIKEKNIEFFKQFDLVIMALDNVQARSYVNTICIRYDIPIIDAGTLGYKGQVSFIKYQFSKCYNCEAKPTNQKSYPVCTIRMKPEKPIHCIVWAKFVFEVLFGPESEDNILSDLSVLSKHLKEDENSIDFLVEQLFHNQIKKIKAQNEENILNTLNLIQKQDLRYQSEQNLLIKQQEHFLSQIQTIQVYITLVKQSLRILRKQVLKSEFLVFEKDDDHIMHFITSAANLRMHTFKIPMLDFYKVKQIAGNIIPAIASTNSIVSGLEITQSYKYFIGKKNMIREIYVQNISEKIKSIKVQKPFGNCIICNPKVQPVKLETDMDKITIGELANFIKEKKPELKEFSFSRSQLQLYSTYSEQDYSQQYLKKTLRNFFKQPIVTLTVTNQQTSNIAFYIMISQSDIHQILNLEAFKNDEIVLNTPKEEPQQKKQPQIKQNNGTINLEESEEQMVIESQSDDLVQIVDPKITKITNNHQIVQISDEQEVGIIKSIKFS